MDLPLNTNPQLDDYIKYFIKDFELVGFNRTAWVDRLLETCKELSPAEAARLVEQFLTNYIEQLR